MNRSVFCTCVILLAIAASGKSQYKNPEEIAAGKSLKKYKTLGKGNYRINAPVGWTTQYTTAGGINIWAPKSKDDPNTTITVTRDSLNDINGSNWWRYRKNHLETVRAKTRPGGVNVMGLDDIKVTGIDGGFYRYIYDSAQTVMERKLYFIEKKGMVYVIDCRTQEKESITHLYTFDSVMRSIRFVK